MKKATLISALLLAAAQSGLFTSPSPQKTQRAKRVAAYSAGFAGLGTVALSMLTIGTVMRFLDEKSMAGAQKLLNPILNEILPKSAIGNYAGNYVAESASYMATNETLSLASKMCPQLALLKLLVGFGLIIQYGSIPPGLASLFCGYKALSYAATYSKMK